MNKLVLNILKCKLLLMNYDLVNLKDNISVICSLVRKNWDKCFDIEICFLLGSYEESFNVLYIIWMCFLLKCDLCLILGGFGIFWWNY